MLRKLVLMSAIMAGLVLSTLNSATEAKAALPVVNMGAVAAAAHVEGRIGNQRSIGDDASTRRVQRALTAKGFRVAATGTYSRATTAAYARYQRSLGYTGINANGLPGYTSLTRLGVGRFRVSNPVRLSSRNDRYGTARVNSRTKRMLAAADRKLPWKITVVQGSYCVFPKSRCVGESGGTHDGGGAIDVRVRDLSTTNRWRTVQALRQVGFAAWLRTPAQCGGCWSAHIHAIAIGDTDVWQRNGRTTNRDQVADYIRSRNGLASHAADNTPRQYRVGFTWWERYASR
jgi:hypothetical protein